MKNAITVSLGITTVVIVTVLWSSHHGRAGAKLRPSESSGSTNAADLQGAREGFARPSRSTSVPREGQRPGVPGAMQASSPSRWGISAGDSQRKRSWAPSALDAYRGASTGDPIQFELLDGETATGELERIETQGGAVNLISGQLLQPELGRFFFARQSVSGIAGDFVGLIELAGSGKAYRLEPSGPDRSPELVEQPICQVRCLELPRPSIGLTKQSEEIPPLNPDAFPPVLSPGYQNGIVVLESLHGAKAVIYLDFQGGWTPSWGGITYARSAYNNAEIRDIWKRVAEDFMSFRINVTTDLRVFQNAAPGSRQRVVVTPTDTAAPGAGGVAYVGSFNWTEETPCWAFVTNGSKYCAQACSHEAGHTLGLVHDGQEVNGLHVEYYYGHGEGDTGWAPIMGVAYYQNVTQWSKGEYIDANNPQQQLAIIASQNNVGFRPDDTGDRLAASRFLEVYGDFTSWAEGVI